MARRMLFACSGFLFAVAAGGEALACGDKLLVVGRGARFQRGYVAVYPASVLLVNSARTAESGLLVSLRRAGHRVDVVQDSDQVPGAIAGNSYEIVLADWSSAKHVQSLVSSAGPSALFLPLLDGASETEVAAARKLYRCSLQSNKKKANRSFLAQLDDAIESKRKSKPLECELR